MHYSYVFVALVAALTVSSPPLNINLGAYSPTLVIGDGEISLGDGKKDSALLETFSGASQEPEAVASEATGTAKQVKGTPSIITPVISAIPPASAFALSPLLLWQCIGRDIEPREADSIARSEVAKRYIGGEV